MKEERKEAVEVENRRACEQVVEVRREGGFF